MHRWEDRRRLGAFYTPSALVVHLLDRVLGDAPSDRPVRVLDPACGDGRFLAAAKARLGERAELHGIDVDPSAVAAARGALGPDAHLVVGDALSHEWTSSFDVVVGNPPYLNQLARRTSRGGRSPLGGGPYADTASLFLALALRLADSDGGRVALVLPQSILATRDTAAIRADALAGARLDSLWWAGETVFDAEVHTVIATFTRGRTQGPVRRWQGPDFTAVGARDGHDLAQRPTWSHLVADLAGVPPVELSSVGVLGDHADVVADFRDQYYGLVGHVTDRADGPALVTSGLIDVGRCWWGERPMRFAKQRYLAPRVDRRGLTPAIDAWVTSRLVPKVVLATQTRVLEAVVDEKGAWLPSVPLITIVPRDEADLWSIGALLCSPALSAWAASGYLGAGLGATALKLSAAQVRTLPWPSGSLAPAAACLRAGDLVGCARAADTAFEVEDPALLAWWHERAIRVR